MPSGEAAGAELDADGVAGPQQRRQQRQRDPGARRASRVPGGPAAAARSTARGASMMSAMTPPTHNSVPAARPRPKALATPQGAGERRPQRIRRGDRQRRADADASRGREEEVVGEAVGAQHRQAEPGGAGAVDAGEEVAVRRQQSGDGEDRQHGGRAHQVYPRRAEGARGLGVARRGERPQRRPRRPPPGRRSWSSPRAGGAYRRPPALRRARSSTPGARLAGAKIPRRLRRAEGWYRAPPATPHSSGSSSSALGNSP